MFCVGGRDEDRELSKCVCIGVCSVDDAFMCTCVFEYCGIGLLDGGGCLSAADGPMCLALAIPPDPSPSTNRACEAESVQRRGGGN